ncbi:MAG: GNAT family N-acetyltransferase [Myxococcota bacterium]
MDADDTVEVFEADLSDAHHVDRLFTILDAYARGPGGQNAPLSEQARAALGPGLRDHPMAFVLFGRRQGEIVGAAVCVWSFSTFAGRPSVNLHDFSVLPEAQGRGVGTVLLGELERRARERNAANLTLEVVGTNEGAQRLYERYGFTHDEPPTYFMTKRLD